MSDGAEKRVRINVSRSWARDCEEALRGAVSCEAYDKDGAVLRAWSTELVDAKKTAVDPAVFRDIELAKILSSVADQAVARYRDIMALSFEQNAKLLGLLSGRLSAIEKLYHSSLIAQAEALAAEADAMAEQRDDPNTPLVAQVLASALGAGANGAAQKE